MNQDKLRSWLTEHKDLLKAGGLARRVVYNKGQMSTFMKGETDLEPNVYRDMIKEIREHYETGNEFFNEE